MSQKRSFHPIRAMNERLVHLHCACKPGQTTEPGGVIALPASSIAQRNISYHEAVTMPQAIRQDSHGWEE